MRNNYTSNGETCSMRGGAWYDTAVDDRARLVEFTGRNGFLANIQRRAARAIAILFTALSVAATGMAQTPAPEQQQPIALYGGTIHTITGETLSEGTLVFEEGVITALGAEVDTPENCQVIDVSGKHVYPGLIDSYTNLGLFENSRTDEATDTNERGTWNPNVRAEVAFNPASRHIGVARSSGVLVAISSPSGGRISGYASAMMLDGWTWEQMSLKSRAALIIQWPNPRNESSYDEQIKELREYFQKARAYHRARQAVRRGNAPFRESDPRLEAMKPVLNRKVPVVVSANGLQELQDAIRWGEQEKVKLVLRGGREAGFVSQMLADKKIPLLLTSVLSSPSRSWRPYDSAYSLPGQLHEANVRFAIAGDSGAPYVNRLPYQAGAGIAYGYPSEEAIRSVTIRPAKLFGIADRVGSLEAGKDATLIITDGNPLEYATKVEQAFIQGREIDMTDLHRHFFEKYMKRLNR